MDHTPWKAESDKTKHTDNGWRVVDCRGREIATFLSECDARLIAATPNLLTASKAAHERSGGRLYNTDQATGETFDSLLKAAIVKAEGGAK